MTSVSVTQEYRTVVVTEGNGQTSVVSAPSPVVTVETVGVGPQGPQGAQGPPGVSPLPPEVRIDSSTPQVIYTGRAVNGSLESSAVWSIVRCLYNSSGIRTSRGTALNVTWTGRSGHTYT